MISEIEQKALGEIIKLKKEKKQLQTELSKYQHSQSNTYQSQSENQLREEVKLLKL